MNEILTDIFGPSFLLNFNAVFTTTEEDKIKKNVVKDHIYTMSKSSKEFEGRLNSTFKVISIMSFQVNYNYDTIFNLMPEINQRKDGDFYQMEQVP